MDAYTQVFQLVFLAYSMRTCTRTYRKSNARHATSSLPSSYRSVEVHVTLYVAIRVVRLMDLDARISGVFHGPPW
jgi:hypothetical protein